MLKVILLRHSITEGNQHKRYIGVTDEPLCPAGIELARRKHYPQGAALFVSPMKRCIQTAAILYPGQAMHTLEDLRECDFGEFENQNYLELSDNPKYQKWLDSNGRLPFPGGESREDFQSRSIRGFQRAVDYANHRSLPSIAIVAHGGTIMSIMEAYARPYEDYYHWHVENVCGYLLELKENDWARGKREVKIVKRLL